jgi:hypothetical protein
MRHRTWQGALLGTALMMPAGLAAADPAEVSHNQALGALFSLCTGETVEFTGMAHTVDKPFADGSFRTKILITGTGRGASGIEYVVHFDTLIVRASTGAIVLDDERTTLVSKGSAPNQEVRFHFESDSPDVIFTVECHG